MVPWSAESNLIKRAVVLLPERAEEFGTLAELVTEIDAYLYRYVEDAGATLRELKRYPEAKRYLEAARPHVKPEGEALVEALRLGVTYYEVQEFRVVPDFAGRKPQLNKEAVNGK